MSVKQAVQGQYQTIVDRAADATVGLVLPAALGLGAGSETNKPLSIAIIGGMASSTLLTLVVVPAAYSLVMSGMKRFKWLGNH